MTEVHLMNAKGFNRTPLPQLAGVIVFLVIAYLGYTRVTNSTGPSSLLLGYLMMFAGLVSVVSCFLWFLKAIFDRRNQDGPR